MCLIRLPSQDFVVRACYEEFGVQMSVWKCCLVSLVIFVPGAVFVCKILYLFAEYGTNRSAFVDSAFFIGTLLLFLCACVGSFSLGKREREVHLIVHFFLCLVFVVVFYVLYWYLSPTGRSYFVGAEQPFLVSTYEPVIVVVVAAFAGLVQLLAMPFERWWKTVRMLVGGVLVVLGTCFPVILDNHSRLMAHCGAGTCIGANLSAIAQNKMAMAYFLALLTMYGWALCVDLLKSFIRSKVCYSSDGLCIPDVVDEVGVLEKSREVTPSCSEVATSDEPAVLSEGTEV